MQSCMSYKNKNKHKVAARLVGGAYCLYKKTATFRDLVIRLLVFLILQRLISSRLIQLNFNWNNESERNSTLSYCNWLR